MHDECIHTRLNSEIVTRDVYFLDREGKDNRILELFNSCNILGFIVKDVDGE